MTAEVTRRVAVNAVGLAPGGGLTYLVNQARLFQADPAWEFTYFAAPRSRDALVALVGSQHVRIPFERPPSYARRLAWEQRTLPRILADERFDVLYAPGGFATFRSPAPQLVVDHNPFHHAGVRELGLGRAWARFRLERWLARHSTRRAEAVVYLSRAFADAMRGVGFPEPSAIIGSGVSVDWPEGGSSPLRCSECERDGYALAVHNWTPAKRLDWLVETWRGGDRQLPHLVLVGRPAGGWVQRRLRALLADPACAAQVHTFEGATRREVARLYESAQLYLSASTLEAFPLTPFEAMSFGVPCVLSDIPEHREVAGAAATFFEPGDARALHAALQQALAQRETLVAAGHERVAAATWAENVARFQALFEGLAVPGREPQPDARPRNKVR